MNVSELFWRYSDTVAPLLVLLVILPRYRQVPGGGLLVLYLLASTLFAGYSNYLADQTINNMFLYHLFSLLEATCLLLLLNQYSKVDRRALWLTLSFYALFWVVNIMLWEPLTLFNSNSATVLNLITAFFCFRYFLTLVNTDEILRFQRLPSFWIVSGLLFYCIVAILALSSYKYKDWFSESDLQISWRIQLVAQLIKYILITIGVLCSKRQTLPFGSSS
ncbi:MAG TPA: hypothetical protein VGE66_03745 [Chitinophagaceae bacterium]